MDDGYFAFQLSNLLLHRCNETPELLKFGMFSMKLRTANETEIFKLTGCLSKCDKYFYTIHARTELGTTKCKKASYNNTIKVSFGFESGLHEIREQVQI